MITMLPEGMWAHFLSCAYGCQPGLEEHLSWEPHPEPMKIPKAAMAMMVLNDAALAPMAEFIKFTASLLTPTTKSNMASRKRNTTIPKNIVSI